MLVPLPSGIPRSRITAHGLAFSFNKPSPTVAAQATSKPYRASLRRTQSKLSASSSTTNTPNGAHHFGRTACAKRFAGGLAHALAPN